MENFGAFYEQTIFMTWMTIGSISLLILFYRLGRLFFHYINTGKWDDFYKSCYGYHLVDGDGFDPEYIPFLFQGTHPGAIVVDIVSLAALTLFIGMAWLPFGIILPCVGVAYALRRHIAKKQDFIAKLDGTHPDLRDNGFDDGMTQGPSTPRTP